MVCSKKKVEAKKNTSPRAKRTAIKKQNQQEKDLRNRSQQAAAAAAGGLNDSVRSNQ